MHSSAGRWEKQRGVESKGRRRKRWGGVMEKGVTRMMILKRRSPCGAAPFGEQTRERTLCQSGGGKRLYFFASRWMSDLYQRGWTDAGQSLRRPEITMAAPLWASGRAPLKASCLKGSVGLRSRGAAHAITRIHARSARSRLRSALRWVRLRSALCTEERGCGACGGRVTVSALTGQG